MRYDATVDDVGCRLYAANEAGGLIDNADVAVALRLVTPGEGALAALLRTV